VTNLALLLVQHVDYFTQDPNLQKGKETSAELADLKEKYDRLVTEKKNLVLVFLLLLLFFFLFVQYLLFCFFFSYFRL
jgi:hypothetical protein